MIGMHWASHQVLFTRLVVMVKNAFLRLEDGLQTRISETSLFIEVY
jgi:hypothetical protein